VILSGVQKVLTTSAAEVKVRAPISFASVETPNRCVSSTRGGPACPRLVVMITTPLDALEP
jgi:hypothetical protein